MSNSLQTVRAAEGLMDVGLDGPDIMALDQLKTVMTKGMDGYDLTTKVHEDYVAASVRSVEFTAEMGTALFRQIRDVMIDARAARLLLEYEFAHTPSEDVTFALVAEVKKMFSGMRVAFVNDQSRHRRSNDFAQHLSRDADEDHNYFTTTAPALKWLLES